MSAPAHLSHSQIDTMLQCGEKYRLTKVAKVPEVPAWWFVSGSSFHQATEKFDWALHVEDLWSVERIIEEFMYQVEVERAKNREVEPDESKWSRGGRVSKENPNKEDLDFIIRNGPTWVDNYRAWRLENRQLEIYEINSQPAIELSYTISLAGQLLKGAIDRVFVDTNTGMLLIVDLKAGSRKPENSQQLSEYVVALKQIFDLDVTYGAFYMARTGALTDPVDLTRFGEREYIALVEHATLIKGAGSYVPQPSSFCSSCGVRRYCRLLGEQPFINQYAEVFS